MIALRLSFFEGKDYNMYMGRIGQIPWNKGKKGVYSEEVLNRMRLSSLADVSTDEVIKLYKKGKSCNQIAEILNTNFSVVRRRLIPTGLLRDKGVANRGKKLSLETISKMSKSKKILTNRLEYKEKHLYGRNNPFYGKHHKPETIEAMKKKLSILLSGDKHPNWKGGITPINITIRTSTKMKVWRKAVFKRDNYTCVLCGHISNGDIEADHIKPFALFPELRFKVSNGRTLCHDCHKKTESYGNKRGIVN